MATYAKHVEVRKKAVANNYVGVGCIQQRDDVTPQAGERSTVVLHRYLLGNIQNYVDLIVV